MNAENFYKKHLVLGDVDLNKQTPLTHQGVIHIMDIYHQNQLMLGDVVEQSEQFSLADMKEAYEAGENNAGSYTYPPFEEWFSKR